MPIYSPAIIRTEWGLTVPGTRITLYDVMDYVKAERSPKMIASLLDLTDEQVAMALNYIESHPDEVEQEYQDVLDQAEAARQYWQDQARDHLDRVKATSPRSDQEELWEKLRLRKAKHGMEV